MKNGRRRQRGIFAIEGEWLSDLRGGLSFRPLLEIIRSLRRSPIVHRDAATREELVSPFNKPAFAWPHKIPSERTERTLRTVQTDSSTPKRSPRRRDRWRVAVEVLENAGHHDVAQQVADYRNRRDQRSGWDSWLKAEFPALWELIPAAE